MKFQGHQTLSVTTKLFIPLLSAIAIHTFNINISIVMALLWWNCWSSFALLFSFFVTTHVSSAILIFLSSKSLSKSPEKCYWTTAKPVGNLSISLIHLFCLWSSSSNLIIFFLRDWPNLQLLENLSFPIFRSV